MSKCIACGVCDKLSEINLCQACNEIYNQIIEKKIRTNHHAKCLIYQQPLNRYGCYCVDCCRKLNITGSMQSYKLLHDALWGS